VRVSTQRATVDGQELIVFEVSIAPEAVMVEGDGFPYRVGDSIVLEPQEVFNERKQAYRRVGYEQQVRPDASLADLDLELARTVLARTVERDRPVEEWLVRRGLVLAKAASPAITNAALLLFAKEPVARWHPRMGVRFFRVAGVVRQHGARRNVTQLERLELPISTVIAEAQRIATSHIRRSEKLHDLFFREQPEYPPFAWQEALIINAVAHRDYTDQMREIEVWFYDDRMEVVSPGDLVPPVTLPALRSRRPIHASRNPLLVRVLVEATIMREEGEGIPRMFEEMEAAFLKLPTLAVADSAFRVILYNEPIFAGPSPEWQQLVQRLRLASAQQRVLLAQPRGFTNEDYRRMNDVDRDQAYREIQEMITRGIVLPPEGHGRGAIYRLSPRFFDAWAWLDDRLPRLRKYFETHESLTNAAYRTLFEVSRVEAVRELHRLVEEDRLKLVGERRGSRYLPGPVLGTLAQK
jgi:ATP-dependent DNA helicase RecG